MTGLFAPSTIPPGLQVIARALYVADVSTGVLKPVKAAWVRNGGVFKQFWPGPPLSASLSITSDSDWRYLNLSWVSPGSTTFRVRQIFGTTTDLTKPYSSWVDVYSGTGASVRYDWFDHGNLNAPGDSLIFEVKASNTAGDVYARVSVKAPAVPPPANFVSTGHTDTTISYDWDPVPGAVSYEITHTSDGKIYRTVTTSSGTITGLTPSGTYTNAVRVIVATNDAIAATYSSALSNSKVVTTSPPAETGPSNGAHVIEPYSNATYGWNNGWRPSGDDLYHGEYSSAWGQQAAFFFYNTRIDAEFPDGLGTKNVTKFEVYMKRLSSGGSSAAQTCRWNKHTYRTKPSGEPSTYAAEDHGSLAWGESDWIDLPTSWAESLINGSTYKGICWGRVSGRYMIADNSLALSTPNGTLRITIGN